MRSAALLWTACLGCFLAGCGAEYPLLKNARQNDADVLKEFCGREKIDLPEVTAADKLYRSAMVSEKNGDKAAAQYQMDRAAVTYRIALLMHELQKKKAEKERLTASLEKDREQLKHYQRVLDELKEMREGQ